MPSMIPLGPAWGSRVSGRFQEDPVQGMPAPPDSAKRPEPPRGKLAARSSASTSFPRSVIQGQEP